MRTAMAVFGALITAVVVLTFMTGGGFNLGTSPTGPYVSLGYKGPGSRA